MGLKPDPPYLPREALKWALAVQRQAERVRESESDLQRSDVTDFTRSAQQPFLQCDFEIHFLIISARNLIKAIDMLDLDSSAVGLVDDQLTKDICLLRNCVEHWEQRQAAFTTTGLKGRAIREHYRERPLVPPTQHRWSAKDTLLGGRLSLSELVALANRVYETVTTMEDAGKFSIVPAWREGDGLIADLTRDARSVHEARDDLG